MPTRFPPPWMVTHSGESYCVMDATGFVIVYFTYRAKDVIGTNPDALTKDQARRFAQNFAKLPSLLYNAKPPP